MSNLFPFLRRIAFAGVLAGAAMFPTHAAVVDDFQQNQATISGAGSSTQDGSMLGGERDLQVSVSSGTISAGASLGVLKVTGGAGASGTVLATWDGNDNNATTLANTGLAGQNLTLGGDNAFFLALNRLAGSPTITIIVHSGAASSSVTVPGLTPSDLPQLVRIPYNTFTGTASFANVGAIQLQVTSLSGATVDVDFLRTVNTATVPAFEGLLTDVVLNDLDGNGKASPGDTLKYTVRISNTSGSDRNGVAFNAATPANTVLGTVTASPLARNDAPAGTSVPGNAFHTALNTTLTVADGDADEDLLNNDFVGTPAAAITRFGGGTLGGTVDSNAAGATASNGGHSLTVNANGSFTYTPANNFTGPFTFEYRLGNATGSDTATVTIAVGERPNAVDETFQVTGNTRLDTALLAANLDSVLDNDDGDILTLTVNTAGTAGTVNMTTAQGATQGRFTFDPNRGVAGNTTFTYTIQNGFGSDSGTVTLQVANMVWYVDVAAAGGGDGRSQTPYNTLANFNTANALGTAGNPADGHVIVLRDGTYGDGLTLRNNQRVIGDGWSGTFAAAAGFSLTSGSVFAALSGTDPIIAPAAGNGVNLASGNQLRGLTVGNTPNGYGYSGTAGNLVVAECSKTGTGGALSITNGVFGSNVAFDTLESTSSTNANLNLVGVTGTLAANSWGAGFTGSAASGPAINLSGGSVSLTYAGNVTKNNNNAMVNVAGGHTGTLTFQTGTLNASDGTGLQFNNADGTYNLNGTTTLNGVDAGVDVLNGSDGTFSFGSSVSITNPSGVGFNMLNSNGSVAYAGTISKNNAGRAISIDNHDGNNNVTFSGSISSTASSGGILVQNCGNGTVVFSDGTKTLNTGANAAVTLTSNTGATINFSNGGLDIDTTTGAGFAATGGGTVSVTGANNSITSGGGTALNIANTTIGAGGLTFQSISANGGVNGIVLNNTGASGGLTVTGNGSTALGGNSSGGTIQNTTSHGISLTNTRDVSLNNLNIQSTAGHGISGTTVVNFTFTNGTVNNAGDASGENSINFDPDSGTGSVTDQIAVTGIVTISNNNITNTEADGIRIVNHGGTLNDVQINGNVLTDTGDVATPGSAILINMNSAAVGSPSTLLKATLSNNAITTFRAGAGFVIQANSDSAGTALVTLGQAGVAGNVINVTGNSMDGGNLGVGNQPDRFITAGISGTATANLNVSNNGTAANPIKNIDGVVIELQADGHSTYTATVNNNYIAANNAVGSAGIAIGADADSRAATTDDAFMTCTVSGNNISLTDGPGIFALARGTSTARLDAHILNNTVAAPSAINAARAGIRVDSGSATSVDTTVNLEISGNTTGGSTNTGTATTSPGINLRKQGTSSTVNEFRIKGMPGGVTSSPGVENYVNGINTSTSGTFGVGGTALLSAQSGFSNATPGGF